MAQPTRFAPTPHAAAGPILALAALVAGLAAVPLGPLGLVAAALVPAAWAAVVDQATGRVPDVLVAFVAVVPCLLVAGGAVEASHVLAGAALTAAPLLAVHLGRPAVLGFGDVKLAGALGAVLAAFDPRAGFVAVAFACVFALATAVLRRRAAVPFAPGLVAGSAVALVALLALGWEAPRWR